MGTQNGLEFISLLRIKPCSYRTSPFPSRLALARKKKASWANFTQKSLLPSSPGLRNKRCFGWPPHPSLPQDTLTSLQKAMKELFISSTRTECCMRISRGAVCHLPFAKSCDPRLPLIKINYLPGVETIAHLNENGRMTIMLLAFKGPPRIVRLFGTGKLHFHMVSFTVKDSL